MRPGGADNKKNRWDFDRAIDQNTGCPAVSSSTSSPSRVAIGFRRAKVVYHGSL